MSAGHLLHCTLVTSSSEDSDKGNLQVRALDTSLQHPPMRLCIRFCTSGMPGGHKGVRNDTATIIRITC